VDIAPYIQCSASIRLVLVRESCNLQSKIVRKEFARMGLFFAGLTLGIFVGACTLIVIAVLQRA
jgi:hypothetical protein